MPAKEVVKKSILGLSCREKFNKLKNLSKEPTNVLAFFLETVNNNK